jgi:hypothetical protein
VRQGKRDIRRYGRHPSLSLVAGAAREWLFGAQGSGGLDGGGPGGGAEGTGDGDGEAGEGEQGEPPAV